MSMTVMRQSYHLRDSAEMSQMRHPALSLDVLYFALGCHECAPEVYAQNIPRPERRCLRGSPATPEHNRAPACHRNAPRCHRVLPGVTDMSERSAEIRASGG
jgi:hypothetical protein